MSGIEWDYF